MQVLPAFKMEEVKVVPYESKAIAICKDALLTVETSTAELLCIKKHCRAPEMEL